MCQYEYLPDAKKDFPILDWWKLHSNTLPEFSSLAKIFLAIPASSTKSKRVFSSGGNVVRSSRHNLHPEKLIGNLQIAAFDYGGVGKTSLIKRFLFNKFDEQHCETVEDDYRQVLDYNDATCDVTISDKAGSHQFPTMRRLAIENCHGFILVYSVDCQKSLEEVK
ncbi:GTP-binding protein Di-Ras2-like [Hydra vulgaris]|uniref:GTP-binding protein Di-Ras2-like n=1 Tax=Hydra vulgaris TaxID=6087 RepID=A0ABM4C9A0_HYDVU